MKELVISLQFSFFGDHLTKETNPEYPGFGHYSGGKFDIFQLPLPAGMQN